MAGESDLANALRKQPEIHKQMQEQMQPQMQGQAQGQIQSPMQQNAPNLAMNSRNANTHFNKIPQLTPKIWIDGDQNNVRGVM